MPNTSLSAGSAYVPVKPIFPGFQKQIGAQATTAGAAAGKKLGSAYGAAAKTAAGPSLRKLGADVGKARSAEATAAGRVRVAEASLAEARKKGGAQTSRTIAAEERLAKANRDLTSAQGRTKSATNSYAAAQKSASTQVVDGEKKVGRLSGALRKSGSALGGFAKQWGGLAALGAAAGVGKIMADSVKAASDAQQSLGATETVFGKVSNSIIKKSKTASSAYGLSANEYRENANLIGALFKNQGVSTDKLAGSTDKMIKRGADLAATFGGTTKEAVEALGSAFKGEFDPLERYGISLKQSTVNTEAYRVAGVKTESQFKKLSKAQQNAATQQATTNLITKQSTASMGAFGRESNTLAGQQQRLSAMWTDIKAQLGDALIPLLTKLATKFTRDILPGVKSFITGMKNGTGAGGAFVEKVKAIWSALQTAATFINANKKAIGLLVATFVAGRVAIGAYRKAQAAWNVATAAATATSNVAKIAAASYKAAVDGSTRSVKANTLAQKAAKGVGAAAAWTQRTAAIVKDKVATVGHTIATKASAAAARTQRAAIAAGQWTKATASIVRHKIALVASKAATIASTVATKAATVAQRALNLAMRLNPIGLVITALIALGAGFVLLWKKSETFRRIVTAAWNGIKRAAAAVVNWWKVTAWPILRNVLQWIGDKAKWLYNYGIKPVFNLVKAKISAVVVWLRNVAWPIVRNVFGWLVNRAKWLWSGYKNVFNWIKAKIAAVFGWLRSTAWPIVRNVFQWIGDKGRWLWKNALKPAFDKMKSGVDAVKRAFERAKDGIGSAFSKIKGLAAKPIKFVLNTVVGGLLGAVGKIPGLGGAMKSLRSKLGIPVSFDVGGWTGPGARLQPAGVVHADEFVVKKSSRQKFERENPGVLDHINRTGRAPGFADGGRVPGFARGGRVGGHTWPLIWNYIQKKFPGDVRMTSNYRPGSQSLRKSSHALGTAIDIGGSVGNIKRVMSHMAKYGKNMRDLIYTPLWGSRMISDGRWIKAPAFLQNSHRDHGHIGLLPGRNLSGGAASGVPGVGGDGGGFSFDVKGWMENKIKGVVSKFGGSPIARAGVQVAKQSIGKLKDYVLDKAADLLSFDTHVSGTGSLGSGAMKSVNEPGVRSVAAKYGWHTGAQWDALSALIQKESSWNARAANPRSSARGLFQKMTSIHGPVEATAAGQAKWGLNYIKNRYGSPAAAWAFHRRNNYYADGGHVLPISGAYAGGTMSAKSGLGLVGERGPELVKFRGGERVYTNSESARMTSGGLSSTDVDRLVAALETASYNGTYGGISEGMERSAMLARSRNRGTANSGLVTG